MVEIPTALRSLFSATVEHRDGTYVIEVPETEVDRGTLTLEEPYRVGVLAQPATTSVAESEPPTEPESNRAERDPDSPPVDAGERRSVTIETIGDQGDGIAKVERGYVIIVPEARPGDEPTVEIEQVQPNVAFARVIDAESREP